MSEPHSPPQPFVKPAGAGPSDTAATAGAMLRQAREAAGLHLAALAGSLKVPVARLEALEAGRIDLLPDAVFARALAASVCRTLKLDPEPVLKQLPRNSAAPVAAGDAKPAAARFKPQAARQGARWGSFSRPLSIGALLLALAALALIFLPDMNRERSTGPTAGSTPAGATDATPGGRPREVIEAPAPTTAVATAPAAPASPTPAPSSAAAEAPPATTATARAEPAAAAPTEPAAKSDTVVFRTRTEAWISVIDAKGASLLRKTIPAGQTIGVSGTLPLRVTVGRADVTQVSVRGEPLDLAPLTKGSIARFEVK